MNYFLLSVLLVLSVTCNLSFGYGFSLRRQTRRTFAPRALFMSDVSDVETEIVSTESVKSSETKTKLSQDISDVSRADINELIIYLEKENPTTNPASSSLLNGVWDLVFTGAIGSPGLIAYQVAKALPFGFVEVEDLSVTISSVQPRGKATSSIKVGTARVDLSVFTDISEVSGTRLREEYSSAKVADNDIPLPASALSSISRDLVVTYLDEDLLVVRDQFGTADLLKRKDASFPRSNDENEPSTTDESGAPGAS